MGQIPRSIERISSICGFSIFPIRLYKWRVSIVISSK